MKYYLAQEVIEESENNDDEKAENKEEVKIANNRKETKDVHTNDKETPTISVEEFAEKDDLSDDVTDDGVLNDQSLMEVDEKKPNNDSTVENNDENITEKKLNGNVAEILQDDGTQNNGNHESTVDDLNQTANEIPKVSTSVKENQVLAENGNQNETKDVASVSVTDNTNEVSSSAPAKESSSNSSVQSVSIASFPSPATEEEASIFKNMKFVLTSATRSKKSIISFTSILFLC